MAKLDFQPSFREDVNFADVVRSLRAGLLDPKALYATRHQAELWRNVFMDHSPIHRNPEFKRIYQDAFRSISASLPAGQVWLIGLGAGTGLKEADLISHLKRCGHDVIFSAADVSCDLVLETMESAVDLDADSGNSLVGDLTDTDFLSKWLNDCGVTVPRLYTFFGMVPNLTPATVTRIFEAILRPGDALLCSANLAPVGEGYDLQAAMTKVLPQYNNFETLAWLKCAIRECGLSDSLDDPVMTIGESGGVPAFLGVASWQSNAPFVAGDEVFDRS